jgi:hypothetical protein
VTGFPVHVKRDHYTGANQRRREKQRRYNKVASICERYLNDRIAADPANCQTYLYPYIADDLGLDVEEVSRVLFSVDCGHNGLTVLKNPNQPW